MKCKDMRELLSAYADGELGQAELELVEAHLAQCDECRGVLADYLEISRQISTLRAIPIEADIVTRTMAKIKITQKRKWQPHVWQMVGASMVLIALIVGLVVGIQLMGGKTDFAMAAEKIVRNSEAFNRVTAGEDVTLEAVEEVSGEEATLTFSTGEGKRIVAQVDLKNEKVMELRTFGITVTFPSNPETDLELSQAEREEAVEIAVSVPALQEFLVNGWEVTHVFGHLYDGRKVADVGIIPNQDFLGVITTDGYYMIDGKSIRVDLDRKEVTSVSEFGIIINASVTAIPSE